MSKRSKIKITCCMMIIVPMGYQVYESSGIMYLLGIATFSAIMGWLIDKARR